MEEPNGAKLDAASPSGWRDPEIAVLIGLVYLLSAVILPSFMERAGIPRLPMADYLAESGSVHALSIALISLPPTAFLFLYLKYGDASFLNTALTGEKAALLVGIFIGGCVLFFVLDLVGILPSTWKGQENSSKDYLRVLIETKSIIGIVALSLTTLAITPLLEETIFRFGIIQWMLQRTGSWLLSISVSALVFAVAHIAAFSQNDRRLLIDTFIFGVVAGGIAYARQGRIGIPLALHAAKNTVDLATLFVAANS